MKYFHLILMTHSTDRRQKTGLLIHKISQVLTREDMGQQLPTQIKQLESDQDLLRERMSQLSSLILTMMYLGEKALRKKIFKYQSQSRSRMIWELKKCHTQWIIFNSLFNNKKSLSTTLNLQELGQLLKEVLKINSSIKIN